MTSYPVVDEGEQKQDVLYRGNATVGVIMEENALQHNAGSSDQRNVNLSPFLSFVPAHARVARQSHPCVRKTRDFVSCDGGSSLTKVVCRKASLGCSNMKCEKIYTACTIKGDLQTFVTGCECR